MEVKVNGQVIGNNPNAIYFSAESVNKGFGPFCDRADINAEISAGDLRNRFGDGVNHIDLVEGKADNAMISVSGELVSSLWVLPMADGSQRLWLIKEQDNTPSA